MSGTLEDQLQQILDIKGDIKNVLNDRGLDAGNDFSTYASKINQIKGEGSCNGFNLFDTKLVDRKLTGNESIGWAEQGTKIYKTDYPDFYNACLKEYNEGSAYSIPKDINVNISGEPVFTHDVVSNLSETNYIYTPMSFAPAKGDLWEMVVCLSIKQANQRMDFITTENMTGVCLNRDADGILGLSMNGSSGSSWTIASGARSTKIMPNNTKYWIKLEFTGTNYIASLSQNGYDFEEYINVASTVNMYGKQPLYIGGRRHTSSFGSNKVGYPIDGNIYLNECYLKLNGQIIWEGTTKTPGIKAPNEHVYYNIDVQEDIDYIFNKQQQIPYYGIDTQNEYVILPTIDLYKNIYYCIGNTVIQDVTIDLSKEIELNNPFFLGQSQYFENESNNLSWLKSHGQWNSKAVYSDYYDWLLHEYNNPSTINVDIVGNLIVNNGVLSGFLAYDHARLPQTFTNTSKPWEFIVPLKISSFGTNQYIFCSESYGFGLNVDGNGKLQTYISSNGTSWDINSGGTSTLTLALNTQYYIKTAWTGSAYVVSVSTDKKNYTTYISHSSTKAIAASLFRFGTGRATAGQSLLTSEIDLKEAELISNGKVWWKGLTSKVKMSKEAYTEYDWVINEEDETFRLPLLNGSEDLPSDKSFDIPLTKSHDTYTAPANGFITCNGTTTATSGSLGFYDSSLELIIGRGSNEGNVRVFLPVSKGQTVTFYAYYVTVTSSRFVYAKGNGSLYYFVGEAIQNANIIDAGKIQSQLIDKLETDLSNLPQESKSYLSAIGMPSGKLVNLTLGATGTQYTAPANGYVMLRTHSTGSNAIAQIYNLSTQYSDCRAASASSKQLTPIVPLKKGQTFKVYYGDVNTTDDWFRFCFIYAEGDE